jgi:alpha-glucoside transport system substrate-binding protein
MLRKLLKPLAFLLILGLVLSACAPAAPEEEMETPEPERETVVVTEEVEVTREVMESDQTVNVLGTWGGSEIEAFNEAIAPFKEDTGYGVAFEGTRDLSAVLTTRVEGGNPPEIAILPNPGLMQDLAEQGALVDISTFMNMDDLQNNYQDVWLNLGSHNDTLYGIFYKAAVKSLVWYVPENFEAAGYEVPETWDEMIALSDQIVEDNPDGQRKPWCIGIESGAASGWPATDWVEDIMLRQAGPEAYDQWVAHEISWTSDPVSNAVSTFGDIARNEDYVIGGTQGVVSTNFQDAPNFMFGEDFSCYMHRQASFVTGFFPENVTAEDYDFFPLPPIDEEYGTPALGGADLIVMLRDTPEAREFMQYLATPQPQEIWAGIGGFLSPHQGVEASAYPNDLTRKQAEFLTEAEVFRFDASDLMPSAVGSGAFWEGMVNYISEGNLDQVLQNIETAAQDAYGQ